MGRKEMQAVWNAGWLGNTESSGVKSTALCLSSVKRLAGLLLKIFPPKGGLYYKGEKRRIKKPFYTA